MTGPGTLGRRLRVSFTVLVALLLVVGLAGAAMVTAVNVRQDRIRVVVSPAIEATSRVLQDTTNAETGVRGLLLSGDPDLLEPYTGSRQRAEGSLADLRRLVGDDPAYATRVQELDDAVAAWFDRYAEPSVAGVRTDTDEGKLLLDRVRQVTDELWQPLVAERAELREQTALLRRAGFWGVLVLTAAATAFGFWYSRRAVRALAVPTETLRGVVERLGSGDHGARADEQAGPEEVRKIARAVNQLADENDRWRDEQAEVARLRREAAAAGQRLRAELDAAAVARVAARALGGMLGAGTAWFRPLEDDAWAEPQGWWSADGRPAPAECRPEDLDAAALRGLWQRGEVRAVTDLYREERAAPRSAGMAEAVGAHALLAVPVGGADDVRGLLCAGLDHRHRFTGAEVMAASSVAADLGLALEQSRIFARQGELVDRLRELDRQKTDFLSSVSHELRTPLTSISGYTRLIREGDVGEVSEQVDRMLEVVERNGERLRSLIENLLAMSRVEAAAVRSADALVGVADLVRGAVLGVRGDAERAAVTLTWDAGPQGVAVRGDAGQLERVLVHLLGNAVKFTPAGGTVHLAAEPVGEQVLLRCTDTGIGIPAADQEHLFERFFRAGNAAARAVPGTGLGLTIVRSIVDRHDGSLQVDSAEGQGTTVTVRLPAAGTTPAR